MPHIVPKHVLTDGRIITASDLNDLFNQFRDLVNTTRLDRDNFRQYAGINNDRKEKARSLFLGSWSAHKLSLAPSSSMTFPIITLEHFARFQIGGIDPAVPDLSVSNGRVLTDKNALPKAMLTTSQVQGAYHGFEINGVSGGPMPAGDVFRLQVYARKDLAELAGVLNVDLKTADNALVQSTLILDKLDYVEVDLIWTTDATAGTRIVYNPIVSILGRRDHV